MYFKRFFLERSLMEEEPKSLMLAALYLAGKVEEERIDVDDLVQHSKSLDREVLHALELRLLQAVRFQLVTFSPFRALAGFLQDVQAATGRGTDADVVKVPTAPATSSPATRHTRRLQQRVARPAEHLPRMAGAAAAAAGGARVRRARAVLGRAAALRAAADRARRAAGGPRAVSPLLSSSS